MSNLINAPLIYTIGVVNFPPVPKFEEFLVHFRDAIREDYPVPAEFTVQNVSARISGEGVHVDTREAKQWQYASITNDWAIVLSETTFCLHTVNYVDFDDFAQKFVKALRALIDVPGIKISWVTSMGFRYVDMVIPGEGERLEDYIQSWVIPQSSINAPIEIEEGVYISKFKTQIGRLRFQAMRTPPFSLPPDLSTPIAVENGWVRERPVSDFAVIDIDHAAVFKSGLALEIPVVVDKLRELQRVASDVFSSVGTEHALSIWGRESEHAET